MLVIIGDTMKIVNAFSLYGTCRNKLHGMAGALASLERHM